MKDIDNYEMLLKSQERSESTIIKYIYEAKCFLNYLGEKKLTKELVIAYKKKLTESYKPRSVNCKIVSINSYLRFIGRSDCTVKTLKIQNQTYLEDKKVLQINEFQELVRSSSEKISLIMETIGMTGIRISELPFITVETVVEGKSFINCKGKSRFVIVPDDLRIRLLKYIEDTGLKSGPVFVTRSGKPMDRTNIWRMMKEASTNTDVEPEKVFPHNLRHLFSRTFYEEEKDIVKLADVLGHSNISTTRIYTIDTGYKHIQAVNRVAEILMHTT